jgi:hypothetical protein
MHEMYERQRSLNQGYVRQYALAMRTGDFRVGTVVSFAVWQGKRYLINGQHTHHAIVLAGTPLLLGIEEIAVESYEEIAAWYTKYDRLNQRTLDQAYHAHNLSDQVKLNKSQTLQLGACLPLLAAGFDPIPKTQGTLRMYVGSPEIRMAFIREWSEEAERFFEIIKGAPGGLCMNLRRAPVMATALVTLRYTGTDAETFWRNVVWDDGLAATDPQKHLNYFLRTSQLSRYNPHTYCRYVASAWSNDWHGRTIKILHPQAAHLPIRLEGTPHVGKATLRYLSPMGEVLSEPLAYTPDAWQQELFPDRLLSAEGVVA